jgi:hypothetical protein
LRSITGISLLSSLSSTFAISAFFCRHCEQSQAVN